jgi:ArsR family transcriptional regulator
MGYHSEIFKVLSDVTRLRIFNLFLVSRLSLCVCEIVDALGIPQYTVSKHLALLRYNGLVDVEKEGLWGYYRLKYDESKNNELLVFLKKYLTDEIFDKDRRKLRNRLALRDQGKCVVGFVSQRELRKLIRERTGAAS